MTHIAESAELYALGALSSEEQAQVEAHVRDCADCRNALADAEYVVATLSESVPLIESAVARKPRVGIPRFALGALAGLAAALLVMLPGLLSYTRVAHQNDLVLSSVVQSHFNHVPLVPVRAGAPVGKVLYARSGGWLYVIVHDPPPGAAVRLEYHNGAVVSAGSLSSTGENATLFVPYPRPLPVDVVLTEGGQPIARAAVVFSK